MERLKEIERRAAERHGGGKALEALLHAPKSRAAQRRARDDRWLSEMTMRVFQAGFVWRVVEAKWPGFEEAFLEFEPAKVARLSEAGLRKLAKDERIIRNPQKIKATRDNAVWLVKLAKQHGSAARFFADWPEDDIVGLWDLLKRDGSRLGGFTGQMVLRHMGKDTMMLTADVLRVLREAGVVEQKKPASRKALQAIQSAFNEWREESGRSLTEISTILARSTGDVRED